MSPAHICLHLVENILKEIYSLPRGPFWVRDAVVEKRYSFPVTLNGEMQTNLHHAGN